MSLEIVTKDFELDFNYFKGDTCLYLTKISVKDHY